MATVTTFKPHRHLTVCMWAWTEGLSQVYLRQLFLYLVSLPSSVIEKSRRVLVS